ncbi:hypothetical protein Gotur_033714 [Gossypium turneri]
MEREEDKKSSLTSALIQIPPENEAVSSNGINEVRRKKIIWAEVKKQVWLAGPLTGVSLFQYSIQMISVMLVGHLVLKHEFVFVLVLLEMMKEFVLRPW